MQGELVGDFPETDLFDGFLAGDRHFEHSFSSSSKSLNSICTPFYPENTLSCRGDDGHSRKSLSCVALVPELVEVFAKMTKFIIFMIWSISDKF